MLWFGFENVVQIFCPKRKLGHMRYREREEFIIKIWDSKFTFASVSSDPRPQNVPPPVLVPPILSYWFSLSTCNIKKSKHIISINWMFAICVVKKMANKTPLGRFRLLLSKDIKPREAQWNCQRKITKNFENIYGKDFYGCSKTSGILKFFLIFGISLGFVRFRFSRLY